MPPDRSRDPSGRGGPRPTLDLLQSLRGKRAAKRLRSHSLLKQGRPQSLRTNLKTRNGPARNTIPGSARTPPTSPCASGTAASGAACSPTLRQRRCPGPPAPDRTSCPAEQHSLQASHQFRHAAWYCARRGTPTALPVRAITGSSSRSTAIAVAPSSARPPPAALPPVPARRSRSRPRC